jgi:hypothetical protein
MVDYTVHGLNMFDFSDLKFVKFLLVSELLAKLTSNHFLRTFFQFVARSCASMTTNKALHDFRENTQYLGVTLEKLYSIFEL